jgi:trimeric autotransporter adhesin
MSFNFSSPLFNSNFSMFPGFSKSNSSNNNNNSYYPVIYVPTYAPNYDSTNFQNSLTNSNCQSNTNQNQTSSTNDPMQMMMNMMSMMMQMMQNAMTNSSSSSSSTSSTSSDGTSSSTGVSNLDTAGDADITQAQSNIASGFAPAGSTTASNNQTLVSNISSGDPNSSDSKQSLLDLINSNPNANPQAMQEYALLQSLRSDNSTLASISNKTGFSDTRSQTTTSRDAVIASLQTLQNRPLSTEELSALPIDNDVKQALLPNTLTSSQIMDLNAQNDRGTNYTPPGGVFFNTSTTQPSWTQLQSQYLYYQGA